MKVFRFMSKEEFEKYNNGEKLINKTEHEAKTNSIGFCFLDCDEYTPEYAIHFLSGIVNFDICAVFETDVKLNKTFGKYATPLEPTGNYVMDLFYLLNNFQDYFIANEYCITEYSKENFKLLKYSEDIIAQHTYPIAEQKLNWIIKGEENE